MEIVLWIISSTIKPHVSQNDFNGCFVKYGAFQNSDPKEFYRIIDLC